MLLLKTKNTLYKIKVDFSIKNYKYIGETRFSFPVYAAVFPQVMPSACEVIMMCSTPVVIIPF